MSDWRITLADLLASRGRMLKRYAYLLCGDPEEAEDLVQEALFKVMTRKGTDELQSTEAYLKRVITNEYFDRTRARRTWLRYLPRVAASAQVGDWTTAAARSDDLRAALFALSPRQRACVVLRFYEDLTVPQVARTLDCSEGTVKRYLSESMARLRQELNKMI